MRMYDLFAQVQAKARNSHVSPLAGRDRFVKRLEDKALAVRGYPHPVVGNRDDCFAVLLVNVHVDRITVRRISNGVF